jgi:hypothetical protein
MPDGAPPAVRKIKSHFFISLDGVVESPDKWHFPYFDDESAAGIAIASAAAPQPIASRGRSASARRGASAPARGVLRRRFVLLATSMPSPSGRATTVAATDAASHDPTQKRKRCARSATRSPPWPPNPQVIVPTGCAGPQPRRAHPGRRGHRRPAGADPAADAAVLLPPPRLPRPHLRRAGPRPDHPLRAPQPAGTAAAGVGRPRRHVERTASRHRAVAGATLRRHQDDRGGSRSWEGRCVGHGVLAAAGAPAPRCWVW